MKMAVLFLYPRFEIYHIKAAFLHALNKYGNRKTYIWILFLPQLIS